MEFLMPSLFYTKSKKIVDQLSESESKIVDTSQDYARSKPIKVENKVLHASESRKRKTFCNNVMDKSKTKRKSITKSKLKSELVDTKIDNLKDIEEYSIVGDKRFFKNSPKRHDSDQKRHHYKGFNLNHKCKPKSNVGSDLFKKISQARLLSPNLGSRIEVSENVINNEELFTSTNSDELINECTDIDQLENEDNDNQLYNNAQSGNKISDLNCVVSDPLVSDEKQFTQLILASRPLALKSGGTLSPPSALKSPRTSSRIDILKSKEKSQQLLLDFGQKMMGPEQCHICGLTYNSYEKSDEQFHAKYHKKYVSILRFNISSKDRILQSYSDGGLIVVVMESDKTWTKVTEIKKHVDAELGFVLELKAAVPCKAFLYIKDSQVIGFCMAQDVQQGYKMIHMNTSSDENQSSRWITSGDPQGLPFCCSTIPQPIKCGINRIWVVKSERRKGIASKLIDIVRSHFSFGLPLTKLDIAFSDPTPDGMAFAAKYTGTPHFLVYSNCTQ